MLEIMIISGGVGIVLLIFSKDNPLDQLLAGKKVVIESKKLLAVAAISAILGAIALCGAQKPVSLRSYSCLIENTPPSLLYFT